MIQNPKNILLEILDVVFAFCHEYLIMEGELSNESAITINKTSSVLSCFVREENPLEVIKMGFLKCLTFSMVRNFDVCIKVVIFNDLSEKN